MKTMLRAARRVAVSVSVPIPVPAVAVAVAVAVGLSGCSTPETFPVDTAQEGRSSGPGADGGGSGFKGIAVAERPDAPDFSGTTLDGEKTGLADYRGKVVVVNAWASYCGPCRAESPALDRTHRKFEDRGVRVLGIDADADRANGLAFQEEVGTSYPSLHDPGGKQFLELPAGLVNPQFLPFTVFVDREGRIAGAVQAPVSEKELREILTPLLAEE